MAYEPPASEVQVTTSGLNIVTHGNVQQALADLDAGVVAATRNLGAYGPNTGPASCIAETISRKTINSISSPLGSGSLRGVLVDLKAGQVITNISWQAGSTALSGGSHQWFALLNAAGVVLAVTSDDTSNAWAASTAKTLNLTTPYTILTTGGYYVAKCVVATTMPTFGAYISGVNFANWTTTPYACGAATGFTGPATVGSTVTLSSSVQFDYGWVS